MKATVNIKQDLSGLKQMPLQRGRMREILAAHAFMLEAQAKAGAPVLTGALRESINTEKKSDNGYIIQDGVVYGAFQEFNNKRGKAGFFTNASEKTADSFFKALEGLLKE